MREGSSLRWFVVHSHLASANRLSTTSSGWKRWLAASGTTLCLVACAEASPPPRAPSPRPEAPRRVEKAVEPEPEDLPGLDGTVVSSIVQARYGAISGCHTVEFSGVGQRAGTVTLDWVIQPNGNVGEVRVVDSSFDNEAFHDCVMAVTRGLSFPEARGTTDVSWRFKFRGSRADSSSASFSE